MVDNKIKKTNKINYSNCRKLRVLNKYLINHVNSVNIQNKFWNTNHDVKYLLIDGFNYLSSFFIVGDKINQTKIYLSEKNIIRFINSCKKSNIIPILFLDSYAKTDEAIIKWKKRREDEIKHRRKQILNSTGLIMSYYFQKHGVTVYYSYTQDTDDTIASFASELNNCAILSGDHDFFRYRNYKNVPHIYNKFYYEDDKIKFIDHNRRRPNIRVEYRDVIYPVPKILKKSPCNKNIIRYNEFITSTVTSYVRDLGNFHDKLKPLRRGLYYKLFNSKIKKLNKILDKINHPILTDEERSALIIQKYWLYKKSKVYEYYPRWDDKNEEVIWKYTLALPKKISEKKCKSVLNKIKKVYSKQYKKIIYDLYSDNSRLASIKFTNTLFSLYMAYSNLYSSLYNKDPIETIFNIFFKKYTCQKCSSNEYLDINHYNWYLYTLGTIPKRCFNCKNK